MVKVENNGIGGVKLKYEEREESSDFEKIVAIVGTDNVVRSGLEAVIYTKQTGEFKQLISLQEAKFMASCDLGLNWERLAEYPVLFCYDRVKQVSFTTKETLVRIKK
jgi:hypothetical protein